MPTKRFYRLLLLTIVLYMFANQTQVGWLYGIMSLLVGMLFVSWRLNRRAIRTISTTRKIDFKDTYFEGERFEIGLELTSSSPLAAKQLRLDEL